MAAQRHTGARRRAKKSTFPLTSLVQKIALPAGGAVLVTGAALAAVNTEPTANAQTGVASVATVAGIDPAEAMSMSRGFVRTDDGLEPEPKIMRPEAEAAGKRYLLNNAAVRSAPSGQANTVEQLETGAEVTITGETVDGFSQILASGTELWVASKLLTKERPIGTAPCPRGRNIEGPLKPDAVRAYRAVCHAFPSITSYGGYAGRNDHGKGQAVDIMVRGSVGDQVAQFLIDNHKKLGVHYIIWKQRYWSVRNPSWKRMADRGSVTANHYDHVHVSTYVNSGG